MVSLDEGKTFHEEFFFEGCGNPVYGRRSMLGGSGLIFSTTPLNFGDEPVQHEDKPESKKPVVEKTEEPVQTLFNIDSSRHDEKIKILGIIEQMANKGDIHEFSVQENTEGFKIEAKSRFQSKKPEVQNEKK